MDPADMEEEKQAVVVLMLTLIDPDLDQEV
jgi:hypothetical protein